MIDYIKLKPQIIDLALQDKEVELIWVYGSQAKGTSHAGSDLDLALVFKSWLDDPLERRLKSECLAIEWQHRLGLQEGELSILDMGIAPIPIAMSVLKSGSLLLSKNTSRQLIEQQRIMSKWEIDYLYHYKHQRAIYG